MLVIRDEQLAVLAGALDRRFFDELAQWARATLWEQMLGRSPADVHAEVSAVAQRAIGYGVKRESDVRTFVDLEYTHGPRFEDKFHFARAVFEDATLPGSAKVALVQQRIESSR